MDPYGVTSLRTCARNIVAWFRPCRTAAIAGRCVPKPTCRCSARLVAAFLECLYLRDVTLVGNDWGGAQLVVSEERVRRLVLVVCEAFDNCPPGLPGGINAAFQPLRIRTLRRLPLAWGWMGWYVREGWVSRRGDRGARGQVGRRVDRHG